MRLGGAIPSQLAITGIAPANLLFKIYAMSLGIDPMEEPDLLWVARRGFHAPLPDGWSQTVHSSGEISFRASRSIASSPVSR